MITMPVGLPEWENITAGITAGAMEKNDVIFSKRQASIQSEIGPLKSTYGVWGSAMSSPSAGRNRTFEIPSYWYLNGYGFLSFEFSPPSLHMPQFPKTNFWELM